MDVRSLLDAALEAAAAQPDEGDYPSRIHRNRSRNFVEALASQFRREFVSNASVRVLSKHYPANREEFGLNELLYDVLVCDTSSVASATESASLTFVRQALWVVESEFARDSRQALFDFNKLVLSAADNKLFIGPRVADETSFLAPLLAPAACCGGSVFVGLLPHPSGWTSAALRPLAYRFHSGRWIAL